MAYIGRGTESISNVEVLDNLTFDGSASYTLQKSSTNFVPSSANNLLISISGVVQQGNFSVSGSTITFDTTVSASDTCDWILHYGTGLITTVADGAITEAKLGSNAVTNAKITDGTIANAKLQNSSITLNGSAVSLGGSATVSGGFDSALLHVRDERSQNTSGGASIVGIQTRTLNTVKTNEITGASLSSNQITLPSGTYYIDAVVPTVNTALAQAYLYSVTDGSNEIIGNSTRSNYQPDTQIHGRFTTATTRVYEIRHYTELVNSSGLGVAVNQTTEVYTDVRIWKVA